MEKPKQELIIRFIGEIPGELLKRGADQPRTNIEDRFTGMHFKRFLEGY